MVEKLQRKLSDSKTARWVVLGLIAFTMLCGYFLSDVMAPLKPMLERSPLEGGLGWNSSDYGFFTSAYGWFNVFLLMLIFGGMILDKMGVRFTGVMAIMIMIAGISLKYWAISTDFDGGTFTILGVAIGRQVMWAATGYAIFGVGIEIAGITVSKIIVRWFKGKELALAMGLEMACARIGTGLALVITPFIASAFTISTPILFGLILLCIGFISFLVFVVMDIKLDKEIQVVDAEAEEPFRFSDIFKIMNIRGFWYIAILCVLFYSAVFPFLKYAPDLMYNKFGMSETLAGMIPGVLPFGTILLTPFFGNLYDRRGKGASMMLLGAIMLVIIHLLFAVPFLTNWVIALCLTIFLGIAFSLVPSAMWPSVPKIIPENKLGTAYALIFWIQNWGLMGVPFLIGKVLDKYCVTGHIESVKRILNKETGLTEMITTSRTLYDYTLPMLIFAAFGVAAVLFAVLLRREDARKHYGLQLPNIQR